MRYFFALWPDENTRDRLVQAGAGLPKGTGRAVPRQNLHITLAFLGPLEPGTVVELCESAASIEGKPFSLRLDQSGWWRKPRVAWLSASDIPPALLGLVAKINGLLKRQGIKVDSRPYAPHLTISRKVSRQPREFEFDPIDWEIDSFCLVQSSTLPDGAVYETVGTWPLSSD